MRNEDLSPLHQSRDVRFNLVPGKAYIPQHKIKMEENKNLAVGTMIMKRNSFDESHFKGDFKMEDSPSYAALAGHGLLTDSYRLSSEDELDLVESNSTRLTNSLACLFCCPLLCLGCCTQFTVPNGHLRVASDGRGNFRFFGPGVHQVRDPFYKFGETLNYAVANIHHGDRTIVIVPQGYIGYCHEKGQPVLLPPGLHQWHSALLQFERLICLEDTVIDLGPWTLLTIDQGYMAVTQDNGRQVILDGGSVYLLTHKNWKFEKFVSTKIQTNELTRIQAASADNVIMVVDATVLWRISDVETAVRMSAETMASNGKKSTDGDIAKLRNDVLKQAEASLAFFIGTINFSDTMAAAAVHQRRQDKGKSREHASAIPLPTQEDSISEALGDAQVAEPSENFNLYNNERLRDAVAHANKNTSTYGVEIISINIISAIPGDLVLQASLAKGAVAAAEAQMMETTAQGKARAIGIEAEATANQTMILAQADSDADIIRAQGSQQAADLLATNPVSVELAKIERTGAAIAGKGNHASFFFGADPHQMTALLSNNDIVSKPK